MSNSNHQNTHANQYKRLLLRTLPIIFRWTQKIQTKRHSQTSKISSRGTIAMRMRGSLPMRIWMQIWMSMMNMLTMAAGTTMTMPTWMKIMVTTWATKEPKVYKIPKPISQICSTASWRKSIKSANIRPLVGIGRSSTMLPAAGRKIYAKNSSILNNNTKNSSTTQTNMKKIKEL